MHPIVRRIAAVIAIILVLIASFFAWFYIEIGFDGCCGAPLNSDNDGQQALAHFGAYALAIGLIWLAVWWGWKKSK